MKTTDFIVTKTPIQAPAKPAPAIELVMPAFTIENADKKFNELLGEDATAGASCSSNVGVVASPLGQGPGSIIRRQQKYTNQLSKGSTVKAKK